MDMRIPVVCNMFILFQKPFEQMPHGILIQNKSLHKRNTFCLKGDKICLFSLPVERESHGLHSRLPNTLKFDVTQPKRLEENVSGSHGLKSLTQIKPHLTPFTHLRRVACVHLMFTELSSSN